MNCDYKIKIDYDFPNSISKREFLFRGISFDISYISRKKDISEIMNQFEYIKKVNNVKRTILSGGGYFFFEALCNKNLTLEELKEFVKKLKRVGFSSKSNVNVVFYKPENKENIYIYKISFETGEKLEIIKYNNTQESHYDTDVIYEDKSETKVKTKKVKVQKCNSCGKKGVDLVSENGFCEHCNITNKLYFFPIFDFEEPIYHIEKQSQLDQIEKEFFSLLCIPDAEPIYRIDTSGFLSHGSIEPLTEYLIILFVVMYWKKHSLMVRKFYMVNIVQILCLNYLKVN